MKTSRVLSGSCAAFLLSAAACFAQIPPAASQPAATPVAAGQPGEAPGVDQPPQKLTAAQLDDLTGPIALYPDPLIAQILPASTYPTDIVLAARMIARNATAQEMEAQEWDPSVKALSHYPSIIKMMDERLDWTQQLGAAFVHQPDDLMDSIQRLRVTARALGHLQDTPEQQVIVEQPEPQTTVVRIVPATTEVVYVPTYDPAIVYVQPCATSVIGSPFIWFGAGFAIGSWLDLDCDWYWRRCYFPVGWSWSHCSFPSWRWHFGWHSHFRFDDCGPRFWRPAHHHWGHGGHRGHAFHHRSHDWHGDNRWSGRTDDAHIRAWSRDSSRVAPHLRTSQPVERWATRTSRAGSGLGSIPNHRRSVDGSNDVRTDIGRPDRLANTTRGRTGDATSRRIPPIPDTDRRSTASDPLKRTSPDTTRRGLTPNQIRDRLGHTAPSPRANQPSRAISPSRATPPSRKTIPLTPRSTSPRVNDRTVPQARPQTRPDASSPRNTDALKRTRQLPPVSNGRVINRGTDRGPLVVPGSRDPTSRGRNTGIRTVTPSNRGIAPSSRPSAPRAASPSPSSGRRGLSVRPSSGSRATPAPSRSRAAPRSAAPSRSAPASRSRSSGSSGGGNKRSK